MRLKQLFSSLLVVFSSLLVVFTVPVLTNKALAKTVKYELTASKGTVNLSGKQEVDWALMINGSIPAPTLEFQEGDDAEITVHNKLKEEVSIHWHGLLLPPEMDGVAYVNTPPIFAGQSHIFKFKLRQSGTYWYHSHTKLQEQKGIFGALIVHPKKKTFSYDKDVVVILSDWSDENADDIVKNLRKDGDYYLYKKNSMRSIFGASKAGALGTYFGNEWTRMGGMDLSDVGYDAFLINGKRTSDLYEGKPGDKVRLRIINAAASSYFYVSLGQAPMKVIAADGIDIEPKMAKEILMGMAETYDVLFQIPTGQKTELRATVQDVTGFASGWIGSGEKVPAAEKPAPDLYAGMSHDGVDHAAMNHGAAADSAQEQHQDHTDESKGDQGKVDHSKMDHSKMDHSKMDHSKMDHSKMDHSKPTVTDSNASNVIDQLAVDNLKSPVITAFPANKPKFDVKLVLGGDMERYIWHINGKAIHQDSTIEINEGDVVRFTFVNETMMHHPMHLHGHFFRVINQSGEYSPLKHTVDVPPHGQRTIEFYANEPGQWMLHCHNLYHMKTGMGRVIKYKSFTPSPEMAQHQKHDPHLHDHHYFSGSAVLATKHADLNLKLTGTWDSIELNSEVSNYNNDREVHGELLYRRWTSNFLNFIAGATFEKDHGSRGVVGVGYLLPMLIESEVLVDHKGKASLSLEKRLQWTSHLFSEAHVTFAKGSAPDTFVSLMYGPSWVWAVGGYFSQDGIEGGIEYKF